MKETFITSYNLENTYKVNSIIYSIRELPLIKKILPYDLYENPGLKLFGNIISAIIELLKIFIFKFFYVLLAIFLVSSFYETDESITFLHIFTFLTISGGISNNFMFKSTKDKYYAIEIMKMDANLYAKSNYYYYLLKTFIGFIPFCIIFGLISKLPFLICLMLPIFVVIQKIIVIGIDIYLFEKTSKASEENFLSKVSWILIGLLTLSAYGLPFFGITLNISIFIIFFLISLIIGILCFIKINSFTGYKKMYKKLLKPETIIINEKQKNNQVLRENVSKQIEYNDGITSDKNGFAYFHDLFVKRHSKILTKAVKTQSIIIAIVFVSVIFITFIFPDFNENLNNIPLTYLPYFVFIMYILNRGTTITQAMFMNCDNGMLTYRMYRTPKVILSLFKERLKTLIKLNLLPASVIGVGLMALLFVTGGTDNILNYFILFISIISMSIFFSVHYLVMYYLLQPYNANTEIKNSIYGIVQGATYFICYYMIEFHLPTIFFGTMVTIFCILYSIISLVLAYRFAPKTFKLRQ